MKILREIFSPLIAVIAAFVVGGLIVLLIGDNPFQTFGLLVGNSFGSLNDIGYTLFIATPLIFTGLAVAVAFRCGLLNIGAEGQLYVAAFVTAWVGIKFGGTVVNIRGLHCRRFCSFPCAFWRRLSRAAFGARFREF
jgi:ABC-type uncharacterized transport system permease subunit